VRYSKLLLTQDPHAKDVHGGRAGRYPSRRGLIRSANPGGRAGPGHSQPEPCEQS